MCHVLSLRRLARFFGRSFWKLFFILAFFAVSTFSQSQTSASTTIVPTIVQFGGTVQSPQSRLLGITFALYKDQQGGAPLWLETQSLQLDASGYYTVQLGSTKATGLPKELFSSGEARWLGVQPESQVEQPRVLLLSVPYALKAADAETIGGLPPSAFMLAAPSAAIPATTPAAVAATTATSVPPPNAAVTGSGSVNFIPIWDSASDILSSVISQTGTGASAKVGINTTAPTTTLDVKGTGTIRGVFTLPAISAATATKGSNSQPFSLVSSAFNSTSATAVNQSFNWQSEPTDNNTSAPGATMNLLFGAGAVKPVETGFRIANNGIVTFASGQTFPGAGTITGVIAGADLTGGGISGSVTLNLDTTKVPLLSAANTFTASQTVTGNITSSGTVSGGIVNSNSTFNLAGLPFAWANTDSSTVYLGFAGNFNNSPGNTGVGWQALAASNAGRGNTAVGYQALNANVGGTENTATGESALGISASGDGNTADGTAALWNNNGGSYNTADGYQALGDNTTGSLNSAVGLNALVYNTTGSYNVAFGYFAGPDATHTNLTNSTAIGTYATVSASNSMVLGSINGVGFGTADTNVGIGTTTPTGKLDVEGTAAAGSAPILLFKNNAAIASGATGNAIDLRFAPDGGSSVTNPNAIIRVQEDGNSQYGAFMSFATMADGGAGSGAIERMRIAGSGNVGIAVTAPTHIFQVGQGMGAAFADSWSTYSSRRWKTNIQTLPDALAKVERLRGVSYDMKGSGKHEIGVIAEEVGAVLPEVVSFEANGKDAQGVDYSRLSAVLIEAVKEQQRLIREQSRQIRTQQRLIARLSGKVGVLEMAQRTSTQVKSDAVTNSHTSASFGPGNREHDVPATRTPVNP